jgi:2-methylcitrate dehydratase
VFVGMASALAIGTLLGLSREQMGHALALALAPNMALYQTRRGEVSGWKGCAAANASRNAVFAAYLARDGFSGPTAVFEGPSGLWDIVGCFDWQVAPGWITRTHMKCFPICYHGQSAAWAAFDLRPRVRAQDIGEIRVETYPAAKLLMANDPTRWAPATQETADHSLPYVVAVSLIDGELTSRQFEAARLADPAIATLMPKVSVDVSAEIAALYPEAAPCRVKIRTVAGEIHVAENRYPKGHVKNPMSDAEIEGKFRDLFRAYGSDRSCRDALDGLWRLERLTDIGQVANFFRRQSAASPAIH